MTTLVACSHGTRSPAGRTVIARIRTALAAAVPEAALREAYPTEAYGTVLPFRRIFVVATRLAER